MVTADNLFLEGALLVYDNVDPAQGHARGVRRRTRARRRSMDVVIFDDYTPEGAAAAAGQPAVLPPDRRRVADQGRAASCATPHITEIDEGHPVMRWVTMSDVYMDKSNTFALDPKQGEIDDRVLGARPDRSRPSATASRKILAFGFSLPADGRESATDLPMRVAFPMLLVNALDWFAGDTTDLLTTYATGQRQRVPLDGVVGATEAEVNGPDGTVTHTPVLDGLATFYGARVGYYDLAAKARRWPRHGAARARREPRVRHRERHRSRRPSSRSAARSSRRPRRSRSRHSQKLWIYLILLAMGLIVAEWVTYHRRITV